MIKEFIFSCSARYSPHLEHIKACQSRILILYHVCVTTGLSGHLSAEVHHSAGCGAHMNCGGTCLCTTTHKHQHRRTWGWAEHFFLFIYFYTQCRRTKSHRNTGAGVKPGTFSRRGDWKHSSAKLKTYFLLTRYKLVEGFHSRLIYCFNKRFPTSLWCSFSKLGSIKWKIKLFLYKASWRVADMLLSLHFLRFSFLTPEELFRPRDCKSSYFHGIY